ncbi:MAG: hypothetical protein CMJ18_20205 [Phycisphaeraceae bacterium]|nr:hypothetical protein [Phycisphaeraceae bacterium]
MHVTCDPIANWPLGGAADADRRDLSDLVRGGDLKSTETIIATGHQPWLWHPGILAKSIAVAAGSRVHRAAAVNLVVDHDPIDALSLELPFVRERRIEIETIVLAEHLPNVPTGCQPPVPASGIVERIRALPSPWSSNLEPLARAFAEIDAPHTFAEQISTVLSRLTGAWAGAPAIIHSCDLARSDAFQSTVDRMLDDPGRCVTAYNNAIGRLADAGVAPLAIGAHRVELPLWRLEWKRPRQRVFAEQNGAAATLRAEDGSPIDDEGRRALAPRAVLQSALMRHFGCNLFVHGTGGALYDRVTEQWWQSWEGGALAPRTIVSADVHRAFDVPVSGANTWRRARWWMHHLPHNIDRALDLDDAPSRRKRSLIEHMDDDRDRVRRARAFEELHEINSGLAAGHPEVLTEARMRLEDAEIGLANRKVAQKRDWFFGLYPKGQIDELAQRISDA